MKQVLRMTPLLLWLLAVLPTAALAADSYILRDNDGYLAAFDASTGAQIQQTKMPTALLRQIDQPQFQQGITVSSRTALCAALEDFCT